MCSLDEKIENWIQVNEEEMISHIVNLIHFKSISENDFHNGFGDECNKALSYMTEIGDLYGFQTRNYENYCVGNYWDNGGKIIGVWGHLDVVPPGENWIYPPYEGVVSDDFIIGRGSQDNKGPAIATLFAIRCIRDLKIPFSNSILHIVGCDEENKMRDAEYYIKNHTVPDVSLVADSAFPVCYGEKGLFVGDIRINSKTEDILAFHAGIASNIVPDRAYMVIDKKLYMENKLALDSDFSVDILENGVKISVSGKSAHAAFPDGSDNAIFNLCSKLLDLNILKMADEKIIRKIADLSEDNYGEVFQIDCQDKISGKLTCVFTMAKLIENQIVLSFDMRYPINADFEKILEKMTSYCTSDGMELIQIKHSHASHYRDKRIVNMLTEVYNTETGDNLLPYTMGGGTYAKKIPNALGFGIGMQTDIRKLNLPAGHGNCHSPDEVQSISNLKTAIKIYVKALIELDKIL